MPHIKLPSVLRPINSCWGKKTSAGLRKDAFLIHLLAACSPRLCVFVVGNDQQTVPLTSLVNVQRLNTTNVQEEKKRQLRRNRCIKTHPGNSRQLVVSPWYHYNRDFKREILEYQASSPLISSQRRVYVPPKPPKSLFLNRLLSRKQCFYDLPIQVGLWGVNILKHATVAPLLDFYVVRRFRRGGAWKMVGGWKGGCSRGRKIPGACIPRGREPRMWHIHTPCRREIDDMSSGRLGWGMTPGGEKGREERIQTICHI